MMDSIGSKCVLCGQDIFPQEEAMRCPVCAAGYHRSCWEKNGGCASPGCPMNPASQQPQTPQQAASQEPQPQVAQSAASQEPQPDAAMQAPPQTLCATCGAPLQDGQQFCDKCGSPRPQPVTLCANCGAPLQDGQQFCDKCGAPRPQPICASCGEVLSPGQTFCPKCGQKNMTAPQPVPVYDPGAAQQKARKKKKKITAAIIAGVSVLSVCLIAVIIIVIVSVASGGGRDFNKMYGNIALNDWCEIAEDGSWMVIDTNPLDIEDDDDLAAFYAIEEINNELGFSSSLWRRMQNTSALNGQQSDTTDQYEVTWSYHPDHGLEVMYSVLD